MKLEDVNSSEWHDCGSVLFQWDHLYDMVWEDPQLRNMRVAAAQYGGPIAVVRDSRKMVQVRGTLFPTVRIFNCTGTEKARFLWKGGVIIGMGWTADEQLLLVDVAGDVSVYDIHGQRLPQEFSLGVACMQERLLDCIVYREGIVALTYENSLWAITDLADVRPQRLADLDVGANPQCMALRVSQAHGVEVILACEEAMLVVDSYQAVKYEPEIGIVTSMSVSPNGELVMAYAEDRALEVLTSDMAPILRFEPPIDSPPLQMAWCANDFLVMAFEDVLLLVESEGQFSSFSVDGPLHMVAEKDCLRVFTERKHLLLRVVSDAMTNVMSPESDHPGRELFLARQAYDAQDAKADKLLRDMRDQLPEAIHGCIQLASEQLDVTKQRDGLKAATYGIAFTSGFPSMKLYHTCQKLRILNNIRDPGVAVAMTMDQLNEQTIPFLISRLVNAHHHLLASKICESMGMNQDEVLRHWACARISADDSVTEDEELKNIIVDKLRGCRGVKYATIAEHAQGRGRMNLARLLLEYEAIAADQVPLLLKLGDEKRALRCAIESGDTDLVYYTIFHLYRKLAVLDQLHEFSSFVLTEQQAVDLFIKYCKAKNPDAGKEMYRMKGAVEGEAGMTFDTALSVGLEIPDDPSGEARITVGNMREQVVNLLREAAALYTRSRKHDFQAKACEEYAQLRKLQAHVDESMGRNVLVGLSVVDSVKQCIRLNNHKAAEDFKRSFGVADKHFWWIKVQTLAEKGAWDQLEAFASSKKSPIGWEPFIKASIAHGASPDKVEKFIDRLPDSEEKVEYYTRVGLNLAAAKTAANLQNVDLLTKIQGMMGANTQFGMRTATMIDRLKGQGAGPSQP